MIWSRLAEDRLRRAIEAGEFDGLAGAGKPLVLDDDSMVDPEWRLAFHLLRSAGLAPLWVELDKEVRQGVARLQAGLARAARHGPNSLHWRATVEQAARQLAALNRLIDERNLRAPSLLQRPHLSLESETRRALGATPSSQSGAQAG
ncbi:MAG: DnaJ family domain-containing protein [Chloroflexota bacterium]